MNIFNLPAAEFPRRWLILAAHYDDEALFFGDLMIELRRRGCEINIAVLTSVAATNPPTNAEQLAREPARQACRLGAFARVCQAVGAAGYHYEFQQLQKDLQRGYTKEQLINSFMRCCYCPPVDAIASHGRDGEYSDLKYAVGWEMARMQHQFAAELALIMCDSEANKPLILLRDPAGEHSPVHNEDDKGLNKRQLLEFYRHGCTQTPTWDAEQLYPEFVLEPERYAVASGQWPGISG